jgi:hypothetical protein
LQLKLELTSLVIAFIYIYIYIYSFVSAKTTRPLFFFSYPVDKNNNKHEYINSKYSHGQMVI